MFWKIQFLMAIIAATSCARVKNDYEASGGVEVKIIMEYPLAENCFASELITTFDELRACLEITTESTWTVSVEGELVKLEDYIIPENREQEIEL